MAKISLACLDWEQRLRDGRPLVPDLPLHYAAAERAVRVFQKLRLPDVPGNPTLAEAGAEWFFMLVRAIFGSIDPETRERFIRELLLLVPKKNSKTTNGALLTLTALLLNTRPRASFILTAPTQDITELAFAQAKGAIELDPVLKAKLHIREHLKTIVHRESGARMEVMTFDPAVLTGQKPAWVLIDEVHVVAKMAKAASALRQLRGGMLPIPEAFLCMITTQSEEAPVGVFRAELMKARAIRDGRETGAMLPVLYEFPERMQRDQAAWRDPINWHMVTPNAGRSISIERLIEEFRTAELAGDAELRAWASQHLNVEIGLALHSDRWAGADHWEDSAEPALSLGDLIDRCEVATIGIDGGGLDDLLGMTVIGRERETRRWLSWSRAWANPIVLQRRKDIAAKLQDLALAGDLVITSQLGQDIEEIVEVCVQVRDAGLLPEKAGIGLDPVGIGQIVDALAECDIADPVVVGVPQGWKISGAIKTAERKLADGTMVHAEQSLMDWCVGNAKVEPRGNAVMITKQAAGTAKIDPLMALFNATALMSMNPGNAGSVVSGFLEV